MEKTYIPAILYHQVLPEDAKLANYTPKQGDPPSGQMFRTGFIQQMNYLVDQGFNAITHDHLYRWIKGQAQIPPKPIIIDFDDHSVTSYQQALPVMRERSLIATMFVVSQWADSDSIPSERIAHVPRMGWAHLKDLLDAGWEIAAHTRSHIFLDTIAQGPQGDAIIMDEIAGGAEDIERTLGFKPRHFAYPGGAWNQPRHFTNPDLRWPKRREEMVKAVFLSARGFQWFGRAQYVTARTDPYRLPTMNINHLLPFEQFKMLVDRTDPEFEYYPETRPNTSSV